MVECSFQKAKVFCFIYYDIEFLYSVRLAWGPAAKLSVWLVDSKAYAPINCFRDGVEGGRPPGNWQGKLAPGAEIW